MSEKKRDEYRGAAVVAFYQQQWRDIHDSDVLDWRIMTVLLTVVAAFSAIIGVQLAAKDGQPQTAQPLSVLSMYYSIPVWLGLIALMLAFYGMWMTLRSYAVLQLKMESIRNAEEQMRVSDLAATKFKMAETRRQFLSAFRMSRRFPLFLAYILLSALPLAALIQWLGCDLIVALLLSFAISLFVAIYAIVAQTGDYVKKVQDYLKTKPTNKTTAP